MGLRSQLSSALHEAGFDRVGWYQVEGDELYVAPAKQVPLAVKILNDARRFGRVTAAPTSSKPGWTRLLLGADRRAVAPAPAAPLPRLNFKRPVGTRHTLRNQYGSAQAQVAQAAGFTYIITPQEGARQHGGLPYALNVKKPDGRYLEDDDHYAEGSLADLKRAAAEHAAKQLAAAPELTPAERRFGERNLKRAAAALARDTVKRHAAARRATDAARRAADPLVYGSRPGTQAAVYKQVIMSHSGTYKDAAVHAEVVKKLGKAAAGPPSYAAWYRRWLVRAGLLRG